MIITPNLHAVRAGATAAVDVNNINTCLGNSSGPAQKKPMKRIRAAEISSLLLVANIHTTHAEPTADIAGIQHSLGTSPAHAEDALLPLQSLTTGTDEVATRDREAMACLAFFQGFLTLLRILTAAFQVSILGMDAWIYIMKIHWALLVDHDGRLHCPQGQAMETRIMKTNRAASSSTYASIARTTRASGASTPTKQGQSARKIAVRPPAKVKDNGESDTSDDEDPKGSATTSSSAVKRTQWQVAEGRSTTPGSKATIAGNTPTRASGGAKRTPTGRT
jgi:hypothetical protein